jgi:glycosyltransferase involved in cell wall biosynthesis
MHELTGGNKRITELVRLGPSHGVQYVTVIDIDSLKTLELSNIPHPSFHYRLRFVKSPKSARGFVSYPSKLGKAATQIAQLANKEGVDLIYSPHEFMNHALIAHVSSRLSQVPWTAMLQLVPLVAMPKILSTRELLYFRSYFRLASSTTLLAVSPVIISYLQRINPKFRGEYVTPGVGVDIQKYRSIRPSESRFDAIFFARLIPEKGCMDLLSTWKLVVAQRPSLRLAVCGPAAPIQQQHFLREIRNLKLDRNIEYLGRVSEEELIALVKASTVVLYPSHLDSFSLVVLESLACGTPVIAYSIEPIRVHYAEAASVLKIPEGDVKCMANSVLSLLSDADRVSLLRHNALRFSERFDWSYVIDAEKEAYSRIIENANTS